MDSYYFAEEETETQQTCEMGPNIRSQVCPETCFFLPLLQAASKLNMCSSDMGEAKRDTKWGCGTHDTINSALQNYTYSIDPQGQGLTISHWWM